MPQTDKPRTSVDWERLIGLVAALAGLAAALLALVALALKDAHLVRPIGIALSVSLIAVGVAQLRCATRRGSKRQVREMRKRFGRLSIAAGFTQLALAVVLPPLATTVTGAALAAALLWIGSRLRPVGWEGSSRRVARATAGMLAPAIIILIILAYACLAVATVASKHGSPTDIQKSKRGGNQRPQRPEPSGHRAEGRELTLEPFTYAELCPSLPNPFEIGHDLGGLFARDGAVKAGCGTPAFRVADTGTWVSAGVCLGEQRSVAVSSPNNLPAIAYGEAAEFVLAVAQGGTLTGVETAAPGNGDVVLVETLTGTYGFARSTRSATPGNESARRCNEVGGVAEPFARMPPPLVLLWRDLLRENASWFWPTADNSDEEESVIFISTQEVVGGYCDSDTSCRIEAGEESTSYAGGAFVTLAELREYMPAEEVQSGE